MGKMTVPRLLFADDMATGLFPVNGLEEGTTKW
jgi:hypothetical protein